MVVHHIVRLDVLSADVDEQKLVQQLKQIVQQSKAAAGCLDSKLLKFSGAEKVFVVLEQWDSVENCNKDNESESVKAFLEENKDKISIKMNLFEEV